MFRLLPRDDRFFELFERQAGHIGEAARRLHEMVFDFKSEVIGLTTVAAAMVAIVVWSTS